MAANMIYRYGKDIDDPDMMKFGAYYRAPQNGQLDRFHFFRNFYALFIQDEYQNAPQGLPLPQDVWLPDIQVMVARDKQGTTDGLFVAAKGGHNDESHNHNDIGNYVVYFNGQPLLIDVGRGTYTRKTFSDQRYEIWYNRSDYHNVPTINGETQPAGNKFKATNVAYNRKNSLAEMSLDISKSYPEPAGVKSWQRSIKLNRGKNVEITDVIDLAQAKEITQHLMTCHPSEILNPGEVTIHFKDQNGRAKDFKVNYDSNKMEASVEKVKLTTMEDKGIEEKWGDNIYRVTFKLKSPQLSDKIKFVVAAK
jgi:hypothetical protein